MIPLTRRSLHSAAFAAILLVAAPAWAQAPPPDPDAEANVRFGPLSLKSTIALSNLGIDTNVFNQADADQPQSDFTMTFTPSTDVWLRMGRTWLSGTIHVDWVYYNRFASERAANTNYRIGVARTFNRLSLKGSAGRLRTRDRPGFEIDARSQRLETDLDAEAEIRVFAKTTAGGRAWRRRMTFDQAAVFGDANLAQELNRTTNANAVVVRHMLTPLTRVSLEIGRERERFVYSPFRDSDSTRVVGSISFQPLALINGEASVGYRRFSPLPADVPPYRGGTAAVNLSYSLLSTTKLGVQINRDVQYSFEFSQPYYLETGVTASVQRQVYGPFDVLARAGMQGLAYRDRVGAVVEVPDRTDRVRSFGIGAGYRIGTDKRLGFTVDRQRRSSGIDGRAYTGFRYGMSVTYET